MARRPTRIAPYTRRELARDLWREPRLPDPAPGHRAAILLLALALVGLPILLLECAATDLMVAPLRPALERLTP
jgi:hypothetical protein